MLGHQMKKLQRLEISREMSVPEFLDLSCKMAYSHLVRNEGMAS